MFVTNALAASDPTEGTHSETGAEHGAEGGAFPPFDPSTFASQLLWLAISFGLFYLFMQKAVVPRIGSILENRRDRIAQDLDEANRLKTEADEAIAAYEQELTEARNKAGEIAKTARDKAAAAAEKERSATEAELAAKMAEAEKTIADTKAKALSEVSGIAKDTTGAIVEQLIGASLSDSEVADAVASAQKS